MADLYHFSTKEDIYASYFIKVSPLSTSPQCVNVSCNMSEPSLAPIHTKCPQAGQGTDQGISRCLQLALLQPLQVNATASTKWKQAPCPEEIPLQSALYPLLQT